jgi:hypothetical protein
MNGVAKEQRMEILELDQQLNTMIIEGKSVEAFHRFYAEDVVAQENDEPERIGRAGWLRSRQEMESRMKRFDAHVLAHAANDDISFSEWQYKIDLEGMGALTIAQVAVRRWQDGKVVRERFYHK